MDDLVEFLRAQFDEDERLARRAAELCGCHPPAPSWSFRDGDEPSDGRIIVINDPHPDMKRKISRKKWNGSYDGLFMAEHIVRHDPERVLAEVDAKRRILSTLHEEGGDRMFADIFRLLALPYADRPGYREEWRP